MSRRGRVTIVVLAIMFILLTVFDRAIGAWTDWLWFSEVRYTQVFSGVLSTRLALFAIIGLSVGAVLAANLYLAYRLRPLLRPHSVEQHALDRYRLALLPRMGSWIALAAVVIGLFAGLSAEGHWQEWMLFANSQPFGIKDPQYGVDMSFYVFEYPFWRYLLGVGFTAVVISLLGALALHYLFGGVRLQGAGDRMSGGARAHLTALVAAFVMLKAVAYFLDRRGLLIAQNQSLDLYGGGYTDINALLPAKEILAWISIVVAIAILVFSNAFMRNLLWPGLAIGLLAVSAVAVGGIYPAAVQSFSVKPSPQSKEAPYIERSIEATRQAYGLDNVKTIQYPAGTSVPPADLPAEPATVANIRLLDPHVVGPTYTQLQQVRGFYEFNPKLDVDRYTVNGKVQDYVVGVREINYAATAPSSNWQNRHTTYTHGYGFVAAPANQVVCNGQPFFVSGFLGEQKTAPGAPAGEPCSAQSDQIPTKEPRVYYGERMGGANSYAIVGKPDGGRDVEFDRPSGADNQNFTYTGEGGVPVGSYWRRVLYAAQYQETNFLLSSVFNENSKLLYVRNPVDRVHKVAPFLTLDNDIYPAVVDGRIVWILDGYTTSSTYPYAQRLDWRTATRDTQTQVRTFPETRQDVNYVRNSVKATVDAYSGAVTLYNFDDSDPIVKAWNKAFGGKLIKPRGDIPAELLDHFRYPEDQFKVQRDLLSRFHVTGANDFFSGQDFWQVPLDPANRTAGLNQPPYFLLAKFPGQERTTFQLTAAVTPKSRQNLAALVTGSYLDGKPVLEVLELPDDTAVQGPIQIWESMTGTPAVRSDLTLFSSQASEPVHGNLLSLPVGGGMLYVEPLYTKGKGADDTYPLMRKVILSYGKFVAYENTLEAGLRSLVTQANGAQPAAPPGAPPGAPPADGNAGNNNAGGNGQQGGTPAGPVADAVTRLDKAIADARSAQQSGDFEAYGRALKALEDAVRGYQEAQRAAGAASAPPSAPASPTPTGSAPAADGSASSAPPPAS